MENSVIALIGGGATALSFLHGFLTEQNHREKSHSVTVYVIEKRRSVGRGLAYDVDVSTNILNTRAAFITPFVDRPGHFFEWLNANHPAWEDEFPGLDVPPTRLRQDLSSASISSA